MIEYRWLPSSLLYEFYRCLRSLRKAGNCHRVVFRLIGNSLIQKLVKYSIRTKFKGVQAVNKGKT